MKLKALSESATQKEFEKRVNEIIKDNTLKHRKERIQELIKMYQPYGYDLPEKTWIKLENQNLL